MVKTDFLQLQSFAIKNKNKNKLFRCIKYRMAVLTLSCVFLGSENWETKKV